MAEAALGLGSNLGDREAHLSGAVRALEAWGGVRVTAISSLWETPPWGIEGQPHFLNACVLIETSLTPIEVLDACLAIERDHGRERSLRWGPRTLDMDVLYYDDVEMADERLILPHPRMLLRSFVLAPLAEIAPGKVIGGATIQENSALVGLETGMVRIGPLRGIEE
ncbi:2-amino-4-hydroxy-6-hydroxymethyldihydropteridine pyrophosphokinase [Hyphomonas neptunium ATCC 15444]|uniref:2-amino-4-hydroxy-6-hydroxymethyldihydropteridine pyrophosphokinase n=2 Tax=Hyphomonas TaxID=85 RepID=Q0BZN4_HYPNA|nr:2-amino-4-hydroxy-6-hydroxymethyldihydropteridine diphosphokinase [Hyphomonas hirschiana]ABI78286.1 2-amino-4-hydroxy-6-hydroxymethyldihydropteridine pyrophosphokinase [Hyphomonas neptunium ATCC 15444]KCZ86758.1 2-amino-4-hydroxy-6-hydroxymethyldihydropteridine pyrophosphokinase [Hyphomonas hirschiana VP5]